MSRTTTTAPKGATTARIQPRTLREQDAAEYLGFSRSYVRNTRTADLKRQREGQPIVGPAWLTIDKAIRYEVAALDQWLDSKRSAA